MFFYKTAVEQCGRLGYPPGPLWHFYKKNKVIIQILEVVKNCTLAPILSSMSNFCASGMPSSSTSSSNAGSSSINVGWCLAAGQIHVYLYCIIMILPLTYLNNLIKCLIFLFMN